MTFRKLSANFVFDGKNRLIKNGILTVNDRGTVMQLRDPGEIVREEAGVEFYNGILTPGFINAHCHLELSHMKGKIRGGLGLASFISSVVSGREDPEQTIGAAIRQADQQMKREGIVAVGDVSNTVDSFPAKAESFIRYHTFIELFGFGNDRADEIFSSGIRILEHARNFNLRASLTPHSVYALSPALFRRIALYDPVMEHPLSIHNQETDDENTFIRDADGELYRFFKNAGMDMREVQPQNMRSLLRLAEMIPDEKRLLLVHNVYTSKEDVRKWPHTDKTWWVLCPASNAFITGSRPAEHLIKSFPHRVCIGTDSLASNDRLSVLHELRLLQTYFPHLPLTGLLRFACINGAEALGLESDIGSFEKDRNPGVNLIRKADLLNLKLTENSSVKVLL